MHCTYVSIVFYTDWLHGQDCEEEIRDRHRCSVGQGGMAWRRESNCPPPSEGHCSGNMDSMMINGADWENDKMTKGIVMGIESYNVLEKHCFNEV